MLVHLQIRNFALIESLDLELTPGLCALTGETGAGKSIVIDALGLALGKRASRDAVRTGADAATVQAAFAVPPGSPVLDELAEMGIDAAAFDPDQDLLLLRREVSRSGPSRCWINGQLVAVGQLERIGRLLVEIHGQHDQQTLLSAREQLRVLDQFGHEDIEPLLAAYRDAYGRWLQARQDLEALAMDEAERARRIDLLRYQVEEITRARLQAGEEEGLQAERRVLRAAEKLREAAEEAYGLLFGGAGGPGAADALAQAAEALERAAATDERLAPVAEGLQAASVHVEESRSALRRYVEDLDADPGRLEAVESRLALLHELKRKYGPTVEAIIAFGEQAAAELADLEAHEERLEERQAALEQAAARLEEAAAALGAARRRWAEALEARIQEELHGLRLGEPRLRIEVTSLDEATPTGKDRVEWLFSANRGEELRPLARVASGGELSRIMLAAKAALAAVDQVPTVIFDEVDAGIGGETAVAVGDRLASLAEHRQVLCVTHLPQIAALADAHFAVAKEAHGDRTLVRITRVDGDERVREVARMLGAADDATSLEHARRLLQRRGKGGDAG